MNRESVNSFLLLAAVGLLGYIVVLVSQKPNIHEIDARIEYWMKFHQLRTDLLKRPKQEGGGVEVLEDVPSLEADGPAVTPADSPPPAGAKTSAAPRSAPPATPGS